MQNAELQQEEWLDYRAAAGMMKRPQDYFRVRNADGTYKYFPEIERWQPGGRGTRLFVRRTHVEAWIAATRQPAPAPIKTASAPIGYEGALPELLKLGAHKTIRALGLGR